MNTGVLPKQKTTRTKKPKTVGLIDVGNEDMVPQFSVKWKKYVKALDKKIINYNRMLQGLPKLEKDEEE